MAAWLLSAAMASILCVFGDVHGQIPDTLDWQRYFPLDVGNQWQYRSEDFGYVWFTRWHIRTDTLIEGIPFFVLDVEGYDEDFARLDQLTSTSVLRYDTTRGLIARRTRDPYGDPADVWWLKLPCGLDAAFQAQHECIGTESGTSYWVDGSYDASYRIGADEFEVAAVKIFDSLGGGTEMVADVGL